MNSRERYAHVALLVIAYLLIVAAVLYGGYQRHHDEQLQCTLIAAQITALRTTLAQPGQDPRLQAARRQVLVSWRALGNDYRCRRS